MAPMYDFKCPQCGRVEEVRQKFEDSAPQCEQCNKAEMVRQMSKANFDFSKGGEGFYKNDYPKGSK